MAATRLSQLQKHILRWLAADAQRTKEEEAAPLRRVEVDQAEREWVLGAPDPPLGLKGPAFEPKGFLRQEDSADAPAPGNSSRRASRTVPGVESTLDQSYTTPRRPDRSTGALRNSYAKTSGGFHGGRLTRAGHLAAHLWRSPRWPSQP